MLDIHYIRDNSDAVVEAAKNKNVVVDVERLLEVDAMRRDLQTQLDAVAADRKKLAAGGPGKPDEASIEKGKQLKNDLKELEVKLKPIEEEWQKLMELVPNIPSDDTPIGDESANKILRQVGEVPTLDFEAKEHWELGENLDLIDMESAAKVAGSRFAYIKGELVLLQFALIQFVMAVVTSEGKLQEIAKESAIEISPKPFLPVIPPVMLRPDVMQRMARLEPRDDRYYIPSDDLYLAGSAEHTMGPMHMAATIAEKEMPLRYVGYATSFRREAGTYGKDMKGLLRLHHFDKIEFESFTLAENSTVEQDFIVAIQEYLMKALAIPYQVVLKATGDMGTPNVRAIDIEAWLPGQDSYRETHTSDLMGDYQARRLNTKVKRADGTRELVHMNDATAFAIGRALVAIMENYQREDGSIGVPEVLQPSVSFTEIKKPLRIS